MLEVKKSAGLPSVGLRGLRIRLRSSSAALEATSRTRILLMDSIPSPRQQQWAFRPNRGSLSLLALPACALGLLPLFGEGPLTGWRIATATCFCGLAAALWWRSSASAVTWDGKALRRGFARIAPSRATAIQLGEAGAERPACPYVAWLEFGTQRWFVGEDADPAAVIRRVMPLAASLQIPVRPGWGLPEAPLPNLNRAAVDAEGDSRQSPRPPTQRLEASWPEQPQQHQSALAIGLAGAGSALVLALVITNRLRGGLSLPLSSIVLSAGFIALYAVLAFAVRGSHWHAVAGADLVLTRRDWLGRHTELRVGLGRGAAAHVTTAGGLRHLVLFADGSVASVPISGGAAEVFVHALKQRVAAANGEDDQPPSARSELPRPHHEAAVSAPN